MLPLLPALIMLIVRGPSALEAATIRAYRLNTPEAICLHLGSPAHKAVTAQELKSLIELGKNPAFSRAIAELIGLMPVGAEPVYQPVANETPVPKIALPKATAQRVSDGFASCLRTRDGPA